MAKALLVTYLIAAVTCLTTAYQPECAVGPSYWCKSFQNAQDCGAVRHCTDTVWRNDEQRTSVTSSTKCEWCTKILENTHQAIEKIANHEDLIKSTLLSGCRLLPLEEVSTKCTTVIENQLATVLSLMKHQRYDRLCQLMDVCLSDIAGTDEKAAITEEDEQSKMLCNVIVRATKDLQTKQGKSRPEVQTFLKEDCQTLGTPQLAEKCDNLVERHGNDIYAHVASNVELSKVCDYLDSTAFQSAQPVRCELCTFALAMAKRMLDGDQAEDKVIRYIDEQVCSRLTGSTKKHCKEALDSQGRDLLRDLQAGKQPMLLCTKLQLCHNEITAAMSPIQKEEMRSFLTNDLCNQLGPLAGLCQALVEKDSTRALQILANDMDGNELCHMLGLCPKTSPLLNDWTLKDDPSKCKRCVRDFTRRKHIAERLVNHSSEFLHHLCGQLPQKDDCVKSVDDSINELVTFIRSLDPKAICVQLNMCDQTALQSVQSAETVPSENVLNEEMVEYMKNDVCPRLGSSSALCFRLADSEGLNLLNMLSKKVDPHQICTVLDICPSNHVLQNCHDKCQCCTDKVELYQAQLEKFLRAIVASTRIMCDHVPNRNTCLRLADMFESNVQKTVARFSSQRVCQMLSLCTLSETKTNADQCGTCQTELNARQNRFRTTVKDMTADLLLQCTDSACRTRVRSTHQVLLNKIDELNTPTLCKRLGYCLPESSSEPSATALRLRSLMQQQTKTLEERLRSHDICSAYGELKTACEHLMVSDNSRRYGYVYKALLTNNVKLIDDDLREHMATSVTSDMCESCKNAVQASKDFWNNAMDTIRDLFLSGCDYCPTKDQCRDYTNKRFDDMKTCVDKIDPDQFCKNLRLCATFGQKQTSTFCKNMGAFRAACEEALTTVDHPSVDFSAELDSDEVDASNSTCILCEYMMNMLSSYIHQDSTEEEIEQSLQKVCNQMPGTLRDQCHEMVSNYGPSIIATLIGHVDVSTVCRKLNLCTKQMKVELSHITKASPASCGVCDYVSTYVNVALKRDNSDASLERALSTVCTHLSAEHNAPCRTLVELFRPNIRKMKLDLDKSFCKQLSICQTPMAELKSAVHLPRQPSEQQTDDEHLKLMTIHNLDSTPQCMLCHYVVSYLDAALKNNKSEEAVQEALARVCSILPRKERVKCGDFVRTYGPVLAELITELADPGLVCRYLGMCQVLPSQESQPMTYSSHRYARIPV